MGACLCKKKRRSQMVSASESDSSNSSSNFTTVSSHNSHNDNNNHDHLNSYSSHSPTSIMSINQRIRSSSIFRTLSLAGSHQDLFHFLTHHIKSSAATTNQNHHSHQQHHQSAAAVAAAATAAAEQQAALNFNSNNNNRIWSLQNKLSMHTDRLVVETLESIRPNVLNEPSNAMQKLHIISETEIGWVAVINSLINKVDLDHPFGSAIILLILEDAPLPTKKSICQLDEVLNLKNLSKDRSVAKQRNISIVLGCLAEKLAGTLSQALFSPNVQDYLFSRIDISNNPIVILHSLIALEKLSQTIDNKLEIVRRLGMLGTDNPLLELEKLISSCDQQFIEQQVGFCARYILDNYFLYDSRPYSYEIIDRDNLNVMLNSKDVSENLKLSPDGLTARNDSSRFESVRCTYAITSGVYYYESLIVTPGVMQIGFATRHSKFLNHEGYGIGDDDHSVAYDGCRQLLWQNAKSFHTNLPRWKEGDIVGCLIDLDRMEIRFSLNGQMGEPSSELFRNKPLSTQYYAAASFMPFQQCIFNFGRVPFKYPPITHNFRTLNQCAILSDSDKIIMPRHLLLRKLHSSTPILNTCTICCDNIATVTLQPCDHNGFCGICASLLDNCPFCRIRISKLAIDDHP